MKHKDKFILTIPLIIMSSLYATENHNLLNNLNNNISFASKVSDVTPPPNENDFFSLLETTKNNKLNENSNKSDTNNNEHNEGNNQQDSKNITVATGLSYLYLTNYLLSSYNFYNKYIQLFDVDRNQLNANIKFQASFNPSQHLFIDANSFIELTHLDSAFINSNLNSSIKYEPRYIFGIKSLYANIINGKTDIIIGKKIINNGFTQQFPDITNLYNSGTYVNFLPINLGSWQVGLQHHFNQSSLLFAVLPLGTQNDALPYLFSWGSNVLNYIPVLEQLLPASNDIFHEKKNDGSPRSWDYLIQYIYSKNHNNLFAKFYYGNEKYFTLHQTTEEHYNVSKPDVLQISGGYEWHNNLISVFSEGIVSKTIHNYDDSYIAGLIGLKAHNSSLANKIHLQSLEPEIYFSGEYIFNHPKNELFQNYLDNNLSSPIINVSSYWLRNNNQTIDMNLIANYNIKWHGLGEIKYYYNNKAVRYSIAVLYRRSDYLSFSTYYAYFEAKELTTPLYFIRNNGIIGVNAELNF